MRHPSKKTLRRTRRGDGSLPPPCLANPRHQLRSGIAAANLPTHRLLSTSPPSSRFLFACHDPRSSPASGGHFRPRTTHRGFPSFAAADLPAMFADAVKLDSEFRRRDVRGGTLERVDVPATAHPAQRAALMKAYVGAGRSEEALNLLHRMRESSPPSCRRTKAAILCYNAALDAAVQNGGGQLEVAAVLDLMETDGVPMDVSAHNILLKVSSSSRHFARRVFDEMGRRGCRPDEITYSTHILHLARSGRISQAYRVLDRMIVAGCRPNAYSYTPLMRALCLRGRVGEAKTLMKVMEESGCPPNTVAHNILIYGLCKERAFAEIKRTLKESSSKGWRPSVITYNTYMDGLCKSGRTTEAFEQLNAMVRERLCPSAVTINILLDCLCRHSDLRRAQDLLEKGYQMDWEVSAVNYNTVLSAFCKVKEWAAVVKLLARMLKNGVVPDTRTYNIVIYSLCKSKRPCKAKRIMGNGAVPADVVTYNILIDDFLGVGAVSYVEDLLRSMLEENIMPDLFTYTVLIAYLCRRGKVSAACHLFGDLKQQLSPDLVVYSTLICGVVRNNRFRLGRQLLREMVRKGLIPNTPVSDSLIREFCRGGFCRSGEICTVVDEMLKV